MTTTPKLEGFTAFRLANMANVSIPDSAESDGARFLLGIQTAMIERMEDGSYDEGALHEIADAAVPVYYSEIFLTLVELRAWAEDVSDLGTPHDISQAAQWALYVVAERLVWALAEAWGIEGRGYSIAPLWEGTEGQDRESYSDEQDRENYQT